MGYDLRRAGVTVLCVVSLLFAAALFPATGFGDYQSWSPGDSAGPTGPGAGSGSPGDGSTGSGTTTTTTTATTTASDEDGGTTTTTTAANGSDGETDGGTATPQTPTDPHRSDGGVVGALFDFLGALVAVLLYGVVGAAILGAVVSVGVALGAIDWHRPSQNRLVLDVWGLPAFSIPVGSTVQGVPQVTTAFLVGLGNSMPSVLDDLSALGSGLGSGVGAVLGGLGRTTGKVLVGIPSAMGAALSGAGSVLGGSLLALPSGLANVGTGLLNPFGDEGVLPGSDARTVEGSPGAGTSDDEEEVEELPPQSVEEAWEEMVSALPIPNRRARTPAEIARIAVERGFPRDAVRRLTAIFREVRYGGRTPGTEHLEVARGAVRDIEDGTEGE